MKRNLLIIGFIFSLTVNVVVLASLGYFWYKGRKVRDIRRQEITHFQGPLERALALSPEQIEAMKTLRGNFDPNIIDLRMAVREKRHELMMLLSEPNPDTAEVNKKIAEIASLQVELEKLTIHHLIKMKKILTPEQAKRIQSFIEKRVIHGGREGPEGLKPPYRQPKFPKGKGPSKGRR
jgi:Spy/CpxP family protein refolding chaperone